MRLVTFEEFVKLPKGTMFYKFKPNILTDLAIKDETYPDNSDYLVAYFESGVDLDEWNRMDVIEFGKNLQRAADYSEGQLFAVFEHQDLLNLQAACGYALAVSQPVAQLTDIKGWAGLHQSERDRITEYTDRMGVGTLVSRINHVSLRDDLAQSAVLYEMLKRGVFE